jgi:hypothetical protein
MAMSHYIYESRRAFSLRRLPGWYIWKDIVI